MASYDPPVPLAALTIAAALLRFATIDVQSYWFDEALTAKLVGMPFGDMISAIPDTELTPPLYYVVAWPWVHVFGTHELALRSLSALFGIALVPVAYLVARELVSRAAALATAALVAFNPLLVWYSQEARPYSLLALLCALSLLFFLRRRLWAWAAASVLALLTHYFAAFLVVPEAVWLVWVCRAEAGPRARAAIAAGVVAAVGIALIPLAAHERSRIGTGYIEGVSLRRRVIGVPEDFLAGVVVKFEATWEQLLEALALVVGAVGVWLARKAGVLVVGALALIAAGVPFVLAVGGADFLNTRNVIAACLPFLVVVAAGLARARPAVAAGGIGLLCAIGVATTAVFAADSTYQRSDFRGSAQALGAARGPRALVVPPVAGEIAYGRYLHGLSPMPATGAAVTEVDLVTPRSAKLGGAAVARPATVPALPPPFRLAYSYTSTIP